MNDTDPKIPGNRTVAAWCMYDWANSAFTTLVVTFVYGTYYTKAIAPGVETGTLFWSRGIGISAICIALLSPVLGAFADRSGARRRYLILSTLVCVLATAALTFVKPGQHHAALLAIVIFIIANTAYEIGTVFYNSLLPVIAGHDRIGRVSGYGWGLGYVGGIACLLAALMVFARDVPLFGISTAEGFNYRATNLLVAGWFLLFSLPLFMAVPKKVLLNQREAYEGIVTDFKGTLLAVKKYREIVKFLIAHLIYNDGLVTVFAFGGIYAAGTFGMTLREVILFGIVLNVAAGLGAFGFGFIDDKVGGKLTIMVSIVALLAATALAVLAPTKLWFWVAGTVIGIFVGPNQSASRSLMGRFTPEKHQAEFFGFYTLSGKITSFLGPILLGSVTAMLQSQRAGVATVMLFFLVGGITLLLVDEPKGIRESTQG